MTRRLMLAPLLVLLSTPALAQQATAPVQTGFATYPAAGATREDLAARLTTATADWPARPLPQSVESDGVMRAIAELRLADGRTLTLQGGEDPALLPKVGEHGGAVVPAPLSQDYLNTGPRYGPDGQLIAYAALRVRTVDAGVAVLTAYALATGETISPPALVFPLSGGDQSLELPGVGVLKASLLVDPAFAYHRVPDPDEPLRPALTQAALARPFPPPADSPPMCFSGALTDDWSRLSLSTTWRGRNPQLLTPEERAAGRQMVGASVLIKDDVGAIVILSAGAGHSRTTAIFDRLPAPPNAPSDVPGFNSRTINADQTAYLSFDGMTQMVCDSGPSAFGGVGPYCLAESGLLAPNDRLELEFPYGRRQDVLALAEEAARVWKPAMRPCPPPAATYPAR